MARPTHSRADRTAFPLGAVVALVLAGCARDEPRPTSALLITLDTTRADALGCYGRLPSLTPNLDALAAGGVVFEAARTTAPITLPAHASMLTGLWPPRHGVRDNGLNPLPASASTLAERARESGRSTAAFVAAIVLERRFGLEQGFDVYEQPAATGTGTFEVYMSERPASAVVEQAVAWLETRDPGQPFFLWVHLFDPHAPHDPSAEDLAAAGGDAYLAEVREMDTAIGDLLAALEWTGRVDDTWVIAVGDHGEALGDHGERTHTAYTYDATMRVPLIVRPVDRPDVMAGERSRAVVSVADVFPTLVAALGLGTPGDVDGRDLLAPAPLDRGVYFESYFGFLNCGWAPLVGWADRRGKYVHGVEPELFDIDQDPGEQVNLAAARADDLERYRAAIGAVASRPALERADALRDEALRARIRGLGYAGAGDPDGDVPAPLEDTGLPDPRGRAWELDEVHHALGLDELGETDEAMAVLEALLEKNPVNIWALRTLGGLLHRAGRFRETAEVLERVVAAFPGHAATYRSLGNAWEQAGEPARAVEPYAEAARLRPGNPRRFADLARVLDLAGRSGEAAVARARARELDAGR